MSNTQRDIVFIFTSDGMGTTEDQGLRDKLVATFLRLLAESSDPPKLICFYTDGVRLVCGSSLALAELHALEARGVRLLICSACLNALGLQDMVRAGVVGGMGEILTAMQTADSVVTLS
jgi:sulfur relay (sulfurtransferase) complex TusBCD TusD component (DsrE family)